MGILMRWEWRHGRADGAGRYFDMGKDDAPAPDYAPVANASSAATAAATQLGNDQLAENKRQYDLNRESLAPVVQGQKDLMDQSKEQGDYYFGRAKTNQAPLEDALQAEAMTAGSAAEQDAAAGRAVADTRQGSTSATNTAIRQGLRYGYSPARIAALVGANSSRQGLAEASAATQARDKEKATGYAKKMDVAGLYRGLSGASTGAYTAATQAGQSATQSQTLPSQILASGNAQGVGTILSGQQMGLTGASNILNAQTNYATAGSGDGMAGLGSALGGVAKLYQAFSDRRLKEDIVAVGVDEETGLTLYEFAYRGGDGQRYRGVMADEVRKVFPFAVERGADGFDKVDYGKLGIEFGPVPS